ncbi:MAG: pilin [Candidatus Dojkabacteria bacterium]|nr:pilin [Candidatus Dojkabacteria bacterium]
MDDPKKIEDLFSGFDTVVKYLVPVGILLAVIFIVIGGYTWISSSGDPEKVKQAQGTLTWSIIGLVFILIVGLLLNTIVDYLTGL